MKQDILFKYLKGETSSQENQRILHWIEERVENRKEFLHYRRLYDASIWSASYEVDHSINIKENMPSKLLYIVKKWIQVAAIIAIAIVGTLFVQKYTHRTSEEIFTQTIEVPQGQRVNLTLSDGTKVSLNSNSKLYFPSIFEGDRRTVVLDGEGFFEVAHNKDKPFHVFTQKCNIKVLGTRFNVLAYNNSDIFETALIEGSINIKDNASNYNTLLKPKEKLILKENGYVTTNFDSEDDFLWKEGIYVFNNEDLIKVFKKLEQYYQTTIEVRKSSLITKKCTGKFQQKEGIEHIIKVLKTANNFSYKRDERNNLIIIY